jgi:hypothetical protein
MLNRLANQIMQFTKRQQRPLFIASMSTALITQNLYERRKKYKEMQLNQSMIHPVIIYTWTSSYFSSDYGQSESIGHMALAFDGHYVSFWPKAKNLYEIIPGLLIGMKGEFVKDLQTDIRIEGKKPNQILVARGLDTKAMALHFAAMEQDLAKNRICFNLFYNYAPKRLFGKPADHTCTSVVNDLLITGGLPAKRIHLTPWGASPLSQLLFYRLIGVKTAKECTIPKISEDFTAANNTLTSTKIK